MSRASAMNPEDRRRAILTATVPLLLEHGTDVTTKEIAQAAGIAEGTIFRVFDSKDDLIGCALHEAFSPEAAIAQLTHLSEPDLTSQVRAVLSVLLNEITRVRPLIMLAGRHGEPHRPPAHHCQHRHGSPMERRSLLTESVTAALAPHVDSLSASPEVACQVLMALAFAASHDIAHDPALTQPATLAEVALHGLAKGDA